MKRSTPFVLLWFATLVGVPLAAFLTGAREGPIENRRQAPPPRISLGSALDVDLYRQVDAYYQDHVPFRAHAVWLDAWLDVHVFAESPRPRAVLIGEGGWLYSTPANFGTCMPVDTAFADDVAEWVAAIQQVVSASGRKFVLVHTPPKALVVPQHLGRFEALAECSRAQFAERRSRFARSISPGYVDLLPVFYWATRRLRYSLYYQKDQHLTEAAATLMAREIVEVLEPGTWDAAAVRVDSLTPHNRSQFEMLGPDGQPSLEWRNPEMIAALSRQAGMPESRGGLLVRVTRPGVDVVVHHVQRPERRVRTSSTGVGVIDEDVFALGDSNFPIAMPVLGAYFRSVDFIHQRRSPASNPDSVATAAADAEVFVLHWIPRRRNQDWMRWELLPEVLARRLGVNLNPPHRTLTSRDHSASSGIRP